MQSESITEPPSGGFVICYCKDRCERKISADKRHSVHTCQSQNEAKHHQTLKNGCFQHTGSEGSQHICSSLFLNSVLRLLSDSQLVLNISNTQEVKRNLPSHLLTAVKPHITASEIRMCDHSLRSTFALLSQACYKDKIKFESQQSNMSLFSCCQM